MPHLPVILISSYLLGSIPFGYILVLLFHGKDVRESGSGNIGATNVARSSPLLGFLTLLLDVGKGYAAVALGIFIYSSRNAPPTGEGDVVIYATIAAIVAVLGHMFPVWLRFKGGKGVATALGSFALLAPKASWVAIGIFGVTLIIFRFVSLSSIISVASFPGLVWLLYGARSFVVILISICSVMIVLKHHENVRRVIAGTEPRFQLRHE
ncbi:MAG TPA: glycerol-3-phosphate 1-O-acyltransferase PlsY [Terriglobales bacterium]|jgi:glycerol-3-phosphate acyltransferase PlsY